MGASHGLCLGDGGGCFGVDGVHQGDVGGHGVGGVNEVLTRGDDGVDLLACSGEVVCAVPDGGTGVGVAWCGGDVCLSAVNVLRRKRYLNRFHGVAEVIKNFLPRTASQRLADERRQPMHSSGRAAQSRRPPTNAPDDHAAYFHATPQHAGRNPAHRSSPLPQGNTT